MWGLRPREARACCACSYPKNEGRRPATCRSLCPTDQALGRARPRFPPPPGRVHITCVVASNLHKITISCTPQRPGHWGPRRYPGSHGHVGRTQKPTWTDSCPGPDCTEGPPPPQLLAQAPFVLLQEAFCSGVEQSPPPPPPQPPRPPGRQAQRGGWGAHWRRGSSPGPSPSAPHLPPSTVPDSLPDSFVQMKEFGGTRKNTAFISKTGTNSNCG